MPIVARAPGLDGLRGVAIVLVVLYHASPLHAFGGGFVGVDLFFVLSGYLITGLLLDEHRANGQIWLLGFYGRRALRILPVLLAVVGFVLVIRCGFQGADLAHHGWGYLGPLTLAYNWVVIRGGTVSDLTPTWSLAMEEQFYVVWPLVVAVVLRYLGRRALACTTVALAVASFAWQVVLAQSPDAWERVYHGTDTRAHALLFGAAFAAFLRRPDRRVQVRSTRSLPVLGLAALLALPLILLQARSVPAIRGQNLAYVAIGLVLIACCTQAPTSLVARLLAARPLRFLGSLSYAIYLTHVIVQAMVNEALHEPSVLVLAAVGLLLDVPLALALHRLIELPAARLRRHVDWQRRRGPTPEPALAVVATTVSTA